MDFGGPGGRIVAAIFVCAVMLGGTVNAATVPPLSAYGTLPQTEALAMSPNGEMFASVGTRPEGRVLLAQNLKGEAVAATRLNDAKIAGIDWAGNDHVIAYWHSTIRQDIGLPREEVIQAIVLNVKTKKVTVLPAPSDSYINILGGHYGFVEEGGEWFGYYALYPLERGLPKPASLYKIGLDSGATSKVASVSAGRSNRRDWVIDTAGRVIATSEYDEENGNWTVRGSDSSKVIASGRSIYGFNLVGLGRTPGTVLIITEDDQSMSELNLADGSRSVIASSSGNALIFSPTTRLLVAGTMAAGEHNQLVVFDPGLSQRMKSIEGAFPGAKLLLSSVSADLTKIVVYVEIGPKTGTYHLIDFNTMQAIVLAHTRSGIPDDAIGTSEAVEYRAGDGLTIGSILTLPPGGTRSNLPLVVLPHQEPESVDTIGFNWLAQAFASRGYAVLQPNSRGSAGHGAEFRNAGFGQWGRRMQTDLSDGVAALAARGIIDPRRVCIVGHFYGGYAALAGVTLQHGIYRCAAAYGGIAHPPRLLHNLDGSEWTETVKRYWRAFFGVGMHEYGAPNEISPLVHAAEADAPILLIQGQDDTIVDMEHIEEMEAALKRAGKPVELLKLKGEDHWLSHSATRLQMLEAMMAFVQKYNPAETPTH
jgi:dienelactone hydrolase